MNVRRTLVVALSTLVALGPWPVHAQDRPAVFIHGLAGSGPDWEATANRLRQVVAIDPQTPSLPWRERYEEQGGELNAMLGGLPADAVAVGHSNGGIVARQWSKHRNLGGIVTIGTPHRGAPLIAWFHTWVGFNDRTPFLLNAALNAFSIDTGITWVWTLVEEAIHWASDFSIWSVVDVAAVLGLSQGAPVTAQMTPYSLYIAELNSPENLSREVAAAPNRVGIVSIAHNFYWAGPARAAVPELADEIAVALYAAASGLLFWSSYITITSPWDDFARFEQAMSLLNIANHLLSLDPYYCRIISRPDLSACVPNDGVVSEESQRMPFAPNLIIGGPAHTQEKEQSDDAFREALVWYLHVPERNAPPEPPPDPGGPGGGGPPSGPVAALVAGDMLNPGDSVHSPDGRFRLTFETDGNLVLYDPWDSRRWDSRTSEIQPGALRMQFDGNLVIYNAWNEAVWSTGTQGNSGAFLAVQDNGDVVIYNVDGQPRWRTGTGS